MTFNVELNNAVLSLINPNKNSLSFMSISLWFLSLSISPPLLKFLPILSVTITELNPPLWTYGCHSPTPTSLNLCCHRDFGCVNLVSSSSIDENAPILSSICSRPDHQGSSCLLFLFGLWSSFYILYVLLLLLLLWSSSFIKPKSLTFYWPFKTLTHQLCKSHKFTSQ